MSAFAPTAEQTEAIDKFLTGKPLVIEAGAGTGKTSTLILLAEAAPEKQMQYVAFNRAIVDESRSKMPSNVNCSTIHSLGMRAVGSKFRHRLDSSRLKSQEIARRLDVDECYVTLGDGTKKRLAAGYLASHVMRGIVNFCQSADARPGPEHLPYIEGIDLPTAAGKRTWDNNREVGKRLSGAIARAWKDLTDIEGVLPYGHHVYLKLWELSDPKIYADVVLFDEAQDASPVMASIISQQTEAQRVYVGDSQQQLYAWLGAVNALGQIDGAERAFLTKSFRFGAEIARTANLVLEWLDAELRITGNESIDSTLAPLPDPDAVLCRTNAVAVSTCLGAMEQGKKVHLVGGAREIVDFAKAAKDLQGGRSTYHRDLSCFDSWTEVELYVQNDPQGSDLALMVRLVNDYGVKAIIDGLGQTVTEAKSDLIVSTAHKSKGREWARVKLAGDFPEDTEDPGELRLLYVAATRARLVLDHYAAPMFFTARPSNQPAEYIDAEGDVTASR